MPATVCSLWIRTSARLTKPIIPNFRNSWRRRLKSSRNESFPELATHRDRALVPKADPLGRLSWANVQGSGWRFRIADERAIDFHVAPRHYASMKLLERITLEPGKCGGRPSSRRCLILAS